MTISFDKLGILAHGGTSKTFSKQADGYGRGEGVGVVIVKRLQDALRDNNPIYATVIANGSSHDGYTPIISDPCAESQAQLIKDVYKEFKLRPQDTKYVEAHGTGTPVGDTVELKAIKNSLGNHKLLVGSVKSNIGHTEGAAGVMGIIKSALMLHHKTIPPIALFDGRTTTDQVDLIRLNMDVPVKASDWPKSDHVKRISINGFGIGGSNCHIVMQEFVPPKPKLNGFLSNNSKCYNESNYLILPLSTHSPAALTDMISRWLDFLHSKEDMSRKELQQIIHETSIGRTHHSNRFSVAGKSVADIIVGLQQYSDMIREQKEEEQRIKEDAERAHSTKSSDHKIEEAVSQTTKDTGKDTTVDTGDTAPSDTESNGNEKTTPQQDKVEKKYHFGQSSKTKTPRICFVFHGQGAQYPRMCSELYKTHSIFKSYLNKCDAYLRSIEPEFRLLKHIMEPKDTSKIYNTEISQPANIAVQIALIEMWKSYGIQANGVIGHSAGEIACAYCAGCYSLEDAMKVSD